MHQNYHIQQRQVRFVKLVQKTILLLLPIKNDNFIHIRKILEITT